MPAKKKKLEDAVEMPKADTAAETGEEVVGADEVGQPPEEGGSMQVNPSDENVPLEQGTAPAERRSVRNNDLLTISDQERGTTAEMNEAAKWNYLAGAVHRKSVLSGIMSGTEMLENGNLVATIDYEGIRIVIPVREMTLVEWPEDAPVPVQVRARLGEMLGATVDFIPAAVDIRNRAAIGSRKAAMLDRQKKYYASGRVKPGIRIACRVVGISRGRLVVEACGVETLISTNEVSYDWYADVADLHSVGDLLVGRVKEVSYDEATGRYSAQISIKAAHEDPRRENLKKLVPKSNYFGVVTGVNDGVIFVRLQAGANAKTKLYRTKEIPSIHDTVSFHVRRVDEDSGVAFGIITRIIKRHAKLR